MKKPRNESMELSRLNEVGPSKLPRGPHKNWAIFLRNVFDELGWSRRQTCQFLKVEMGWLKKALNGEDIDGAYRLPFEAKLKTAWDEYRKNRPQLDVLEWPPYVEDAAWDRNQKVSSFAKLGSLQDSLALFQDQLTAFRSSLASQENSAKTESNSAEDECPKTAFDTFAWNLGMFWMTHEDSALQSSFIDLFDREDCSDKIRAKKIGLGLFGLGEKLVKKSDRLNYRDAAFHAVDIYWVGMIFLIGSNNQLQAVKLIKQQIKEAVPYGDILVIANLELLLSVCYEYIYKETVGSRTRRYVMLGLAAAEAALSRLSRRTFPYDWAVAQCLVGRHLLERATNIGDKLSLPVLCNAEKALRLALQQSEIGSHCYSAAAMTLGEILVTQIKLFSRLGQHRQEKQLVNSAERLLRHLIGNISPTGFPGAWAGLQHSYGQVLMFSCQNFLKRVVVEPELLKELRKLTLKSIQAFKYGILALVEQKVPADSELLNDLVYHLLFAKGIYDCFAHNDTSLLKTLMPTGKPVRIGPPKTIEV